MQHEGGGCQAEAAGAIASLSRKQGAPFRREVLPNKGYEAAADA